MPTLNLRKLLSQVPGYASGNLQQSLDENQDPGVQVLTPQNQQAITRQRRVEPSGGGMRDLFAQESQAPPPTMPEPPLGEPPAMRQPIQMAETLNGVPFGTRDRRTQMRDFVADDAQALRDLENQPRNWKDKVVDVVRAVNQGVNGPQQFQLPTKRERGITEAQSRLGRSMAVEKQQSASQLGSLIPVQLHDGSVVMAPARTAGSLASQQQRVGQGETKIDQTDRRLDQGDIALDLREEGLKSTDRRRRIQSAMQIYNSGGANNPATLAQLSKALNLPADLEAKFNSGEVIPQVDNSGQLQLINKRDGSVVNTGVTSYETTKESGRNARQERQARAAMARTEKLIAAGISKLGDPDVTEATAASLEDQVAENEEEADRQTQAGFPSQAAKALERAADLRKSIANLREAANKARTAQSATVPSVPPKGRGRLTEQQVRDEATKAGLDPDEAVRRARLKKRL